MIISADQSNIDQLVQMGLKLWPDNVYNDLKAEFESAIMANDEAMFLYENEDRQLIAFMQVSVRNQYVEGCETTPVAYLEGIFVEEQERSKGIAQAMVRFAEDWGRSKGCTELGSDCELDNTLSIDFHKAIGFEEANRLVCFIKPIGQ